jgi:hypothetical protein
MIAKKYDNAGHVSRETLLERVRHREVARGLQGVTATLDVPATTGLYTGDMGAWERGREVVCMPATPVPHAIYGQMATVAIARELSREV